MLHNFRRSDEQARSQQAPNGAGTGLATASCPRRSAMRNPVSVHFETPGVNSGSDALRRQSTSEGVACTFGFVTDISGFLALEDEWNALFERSARPHHVFQSFNWCWHWVNAYLANGHLERVQAALSGGNEGSVSLCLLTGRCDGKLVMVWPLVVTKAHGVRKLTWLGQPVTQYGDALVDDVADKASSLSGALTFLTGNARADVLSIWKVRDDANVAQLLKSSRAMETDHQQAPFLDLSDNADGVTFEKYSRRKSAKAAKNLRRKKRRLEETGSVEFAVLPDGHDAVDACNTAMRLKREWLNARGIYSRALRDIRTDRFFADAVCAQTRPVGARVSTLRVDGRDVALEIAFACKGALAVHLITYDPTFQRFGAGAVAMDASVSACWSEGFHTYDLLAPGDSYKKDWADASVSVRDYVMPLTRRGRAWIVAYELVGKRRIKALLDKAPVWARRLVGFCLDFVRKCVRRTGY